MTGESSGVWGQVYAVMGQGSTQLSTREMVESDGTMEHS